MRKIVYFLSLFIIFFVCGLFGFLIYCTAQVSENYWCFNDDLPKDIVPSIKLFKNYDSVPVGKNFFSFVNNEQFTAFLFNLIPVKNVAVQNFERKIFVRPCGIPFGLKIFTDGVLVVDLQKIKTSEGEKFPAGSANIKKGDMLISVNGCKVTGNSQLKNLVQKSRGKPLKLKIKRNDKYIETEIKPVLSFDKKKWLSGIWVRDSSAGLGTLTFSTKSGYFGGLGHPVYDVDTGNNLPIGSGEIVEASIYDVVQGSCSKPGELCGELKNDKPMGKIEINTESGLYGVLNKPLELHEFVPIGLKHEIKTGRAYIYSTVDEGAPQKYEIEIESIDFKQDVKNFVVKIVDESLLKKTGGIVQGMSGSPIIQDEKFIGAITHVFLNDPTRGYGVFAETMIMTSQEIAKYRNF